MQPNIPQPNPERGETTRRTKSQGAAPTAAGGGFSPEDSISASETGIMRALDGTVRAKLPPTMRSIGVRIIGERVYLDSTSPSATELAKTIVAKLKDLKTEPGQEVKFGCPSGSFLILEERGSGAQQEIKVGTIKVMRLPLREGGGVIISRARDREGKKIVFPVTPASGPNLEDLDQTETLIPMDTPPSPPETRSAEPARAPERSPEAKASWAVEIALRELVKIKARDQQAQLEGSGTGWAQMVLDHLQARESAESRTRKPAMMELFKQTMDPLNSANAKLAGALLPFCLEIVRSPRWIGFSRTFPFVKLPAFSTTGRLTNQVRTFAGELVKTFGGDSQGSEQIKLVYGRRRSFAEIVTKLESNNPVMQAGAARQILLNAAVENELRALPADPKERAAQIAVLEGAVGKLSQTKYYLGLTAKARADCNQSLAAIHGHIEKGKAGTFGVKPKRGNT